MFDRRYNIGAWAWELQRFPARSVRPLLHYDEIWVGSSFIASAIAPISPIPVIRIPPVMAPAMGGVVVEDQVGWRRRPDEFLFVFMFDVHSHLARKNPLAVIEAFRRAFRPSEPVRLILKCVNAESDPTGFATLSIARPAPRLTFTPATSPPTPSAASCPAAMPTCRCIAPKGLA